MQLKKKAWRHESELAMVRDWFYPQHATFDPYSTAPADMRQRAIDLVALWSSKDPRLTHAVGATASLTEALVHDELSDRERYISDSALRSIYAMAFCRFVNGLVDRDVAKASAAALLIAPEASADEDMTQRNRNENSMFSLARKIELPITFVELRHRATHGRMPDLSYLRKMTREGLEWLYEKWWTKNVTASPDRALRALELERIEAEERRIQRQTNEDENEDENEGTGSRLDKTWEAVDGDEAADRSSVRISDAADEMLCANCRKRKHRDWDE